MAVFNRVEERCPSSSTTPHSSPTPISTTRQCSTSSVCALACGCWIEVLSENSSFICLSQCLIRGGTLRKCSLGEKRKEGMTERSTRSPFCLGKVGLCRRQHPALSVRTLRAEHKESKSHLPGWRNPTSDRLNSPLRFTRVETLKSVPSIRKGLGWKDRGAEAKGEETGRNANQGKHVAATWQRLRWESRLTRMRTPGLVWSGNAGGQRC